MATVTLKVYRFNPDSDPRPDHQEYTIPWSPGLSALQGLRYIYENLDATLAFRDYHCGRGLCGSCRLTINGKPQKGCRALLEKGREYVVEPDQGLPVIRDLVVDFQEVKAHDGR